MSHISDCVDALSTNDYPLITTGWPDDEYGIHHEAYREWVENIASNLDDDTVQFGQTPLIAAMRCYVASKLGDTVEIPEELL